MTVQCPRCRTQYKVPNARISDPRPVFKCTRCSLVFSREAERPPRAGARERDERNLALPFGSRKDASSGRAADDGPRIAGPDDPTVHASLDEDEREAAPEEPEQEEEEETAEHQLDADPDEHEEADADDAAVEDAEGDDDEEEDEAEDEPAPPRPARRAASPPPPPARRARDERPARDAEPAFVAQASRGRPAAPPRGRERDELRFRRDQDDDVFDGGPDLDEEDDEPRRPVLVASEAKQRRAPITPRRGARSAQAAQRSPLRAIAIGVGAVVAVYFALAVALDRQPAAALETLSGVPLLGRLLGGDHLLLWRIQLAGVEGGLDEIKGGRPAYVVAGRAINTSNEDLRIIEIEGRLLVDGVEQRRQVVYAANHSRKTIRDLSPSEVEMLLRLEPNRRFVIRPGESKSFLLVFPDPPQDTTEVTCRVVNARTA